MIKDAFKQECGITTNLVYCLREKGITVEDYYNSETLEGENETIPFETVATRVLGEKTFTCSFKYGHRNLAEIFQVGNGNLTSVEQFITTNQTKSEDKKGIQTFPFFINDIRKGLPLCVPKLLKNSVERTVQIAKQIGVQADDVRMISIGGVGIIGFICEDETIEVLDFGLTGNLRNNLNIRALIRGTYLGERDFHALQCALELADKTNLEDREEWGAQLENLLAKHNSHQRLFINSERKIKINPRTRRHPLLLCLRSKNTSPLTREIFEEVSVNLAKIPTMGNNLLIERLSQIKKETVNKNTKMPLNEINIGQKGQQTNSPRESQLEEGENLDQNEGIFAKAINFCKKPSIKSLGGGAVIGVISFCVAFFALSFSAIISLAFSAILVAASSFGLWQFFFKESKEDNA